MIVIWEKRQSDLVSHLVGCLAYSIIVIIDMNIDIDIIIMTYIYIHTLFYLTYVTLIRMIIFTKV